MNLLKKIKWGINASWNSSTVTSWANYGVQSVRLIILLPLILRFFDEVQTAVWLLFASIVFFIAVVQDQLSTILSRMIAMAYGGAEDLSPITPGEASRGTGIANWPLIKRVHQTTSSLNLMISLMGLIVASVFGYFALEKLVEGYEQAWEVWLALVVMLTGQFLLQAFRKYAILLRGLNYVALINRYLVAFNILSTLSGIVALLLGASILPLSIVMQSFALINIFFMRRALIDKTNTFVMLSEVYEFDKEIVGWLWTPLWRSFIQVMANRGGGRVGVVLLARHTSPGELSAALLALRLLDTLDSVALAPLYSKVPGFSRLLASGDINKLTKGLFRSLTLSQWLLVGGCIAIGTLGPTALPLIKPDLQFLDPNVFFSMAIGFCLVSFIRQSLIISILGNRVVAVFQLACAAIISILLGYLLIPSLGMTGYVLSAYLPSIFLVNFWPLNEASLLLERSLSLILSSIYMRPWGLLFVVSALFIFII